MFGSVAKAVGNTLKEGGKAALKAAAPIAIDTGNKVADELAIAAQTIVDAAVERLCQELHEATNRVCETIEGQREKEKEKEQRGKEARR